MNTPNELKAVRLDRWLWSVRVFKTRALAAKGINGGKIKVNGDNAKASRQVKVGDTISYKKEGRTYDYEVTGLIEKRVSAKDALQMYHLTEDADLSPTMKELVQAYRKSQQQVPQSKRPSKKDRRLLHKLKRGDKA